jgi:hypothetical protein
MLILAFGENHLPHNRHIYESPFRLFVDSR